MIFCVLCVLLAASSASAQRKTRPKFGDFFGSIDPKPTNVQQTRPGPNDGTSITVTAKVQCSSEAWAGTLTSSSDTYASAVASAVADVCSYNFASIQPAYRRLLNWATAYAEAHAAAYAQCTSSVSGGGKASGCAWAKADAYAITVAYAEAHASATAEAFASWCVCENAEAWAFGEADLVLALLAEAHAQAEAIACASGNESSSASVYVSCYAQIIAKVFANALAEATASANCWAYSGDAHAVATIKAEVGAELQQYEYCVIDISESGTADGSAGGSSAQTLPIDRTRRHL